jgi:hypothetical protein
MSTKPEKSIEDSREEFKEKALRYLREHPEAMRRVDRVGQVAQWTKEGGARYEDWRKSQIHEGRLQQTEQYAAEFEAAPVVRRTLDQRIESMVKRLLLLPPELREAMLEQIASEYWKAGMPVSGEDLKALATHYLNRAQNRVGGHAGIRTTNRPVTPAER